MGRSSFRLSESSTSSLNHVEAEIPEGGNKRQGWYLSYAGAFIVILAAIALSTAVGLIVHFAHPARRLQCRPCPTDTPVTSRPIGTSLTPRVTSATPRATQPTTPTGVTPDWDALWEVCKNLSVSRNESLPGFTTALPTPTAPASTAPPKSIRLPGNLAPIHYVIRLRPFIYSNNTADFYFNGSVRAELRCVQPTKTITLHDNIRGGTHSNIRVMKMSSSLPIRVVSWSFEDDLEFIHLELEDTLEVDQVYEVSMDYSAPLRKDLKGIYYSDYTVNGEKRYLITSQLQTTGARKVFPCLDEPALKATFNTTIERMSHMKSMSNTEVIRSEPLADDWVADYYGVTPVMSTYILAFMVSDFNCTSSTTSNGKLVEICARPNAMDQTTFAAGIAGDIQEFFEVYHNISYPLPKTIHTAVQDFAAGAMENWGLIIYRETALLYDAAAATADQRQRVAKVIAHELAHQWFGNLVTAKWWDHIWLNEGFASYLENIGTNRVFPEWNTLDEMVVTKVQRVFGADSLASSRPIYQQVNNYNDISQVFDPITYSKGASVIRMMKHFLGEETFRWGLSNYLKDRAYKTATSCDVFRFLSKQAESDGKKIDVEGVMDTWVRQMGYPVVTFTFNNVTGNVDLKQSHFLLNPKQTVERKSPYGYIWKIPISVVTSKTTDLEQHVSGWLNDPTGKIDMQQKGVKWILGNIKQRYYYRVNYNSENWDALVAQLMEDPMKIDQTNRAQIIDDTMNLGRAGHVDQTLTLQVARYLKAEEEFIPWVSVSRAFGYMDRMLSQTSFYGYFRTFMQKNVENTHKLIGWEKSTNDTHLQQRLRTRITNLACHYGLESCLKAANTRFQQWMKEDTANGTNSIDRNLRPVVYCSGVETGDVAEWEFAFRKYQEVNTGAEKSTLLRAMACTRNYWLIRRYLQEALSEKVLRRQDFHIIIRHLATNPIGRGIAWNFLQDNWKVIKERFGLSTFALRSAVTALSAAFSTERELRELQGFMVSNPDQGTATLAFKNAVETTKSNIEWRQQNENNIKQWLQNNAQSISL